MKLQLFSIVAILISGAVISVSGCKHTDAGIMDKDKADKVLLRFSDSIYIIPVEAEKAFAEVQKEMSDSDSYYKLDLFRGIAGLIAGDKDSYYVSHERAADYCRRNPDAFIVSGIYWNHEGMVQHSMGDTDSAIACYKKSYKSMQMANDWKRLTNVCINLADLYRSKGRMAASAKFYRRALFLADSVGDHSMDFSVLSGLGSVYADMGNFTESGKYFGKAGDLVNDATDFDVFFYYNSLGNSLYFQKRYDEALNIFRKAYFRACGIGQSDLIAIAEANMGEVFMYKNCLDSATYYLNSAEMRFSSITGVDQSTSFYMNSLLGGLALRRNDMAEARRYLSLAKIDTMVLRPKYIALHYHRLQEYYAKTNDFRNAYDYEMLASRYDSMLNSRMIRSQMAEIRYRYDQDTTLLHRNIKIREQEKEMEELSMFNTSVVVAIILLVIIAALYFAYRKKKESVTRLQMERSLMSLRVENIRNRVSPHFIFNVLNRELDAKNDGVDRLVRLLRMNLDLCDRYIVPLSDEIEFINIYVELERKALGDDFTYRLDVDDSVDLDNYHLPSMMIQIFVENALKHGLRGTDGEKWLNLSIKHVENNLEITVENNGSNHGAVAGRIGTGLKVVMRTIHMLNERNENKLILEYGSSTAGMWSVKIVIPDGYDFSMMQ